VVNEFLEYPQNGHRYRLGVDVALREDWTVISVLDLTDRKIKYVYRTNKIDLELVLSRIENEARKWTTNQGPPEVVLDATGMGDPIYEALVQRGLNILPVKFTQMNKRQMVDNLAMLFNRDEIKIPNYAWLIDELKDYRYSRSEATGKYFYGAPQGKHDDGCVSLMLACYQLPPIQQVRTFNSTPITGKFNRWTGVEY
jgi:phage FluMu gp28-like protein